MKKVLITLAFGLYAILGFAHNPDVSTTMLVEKENNQWVLQISASLTAFQYEIKAHFPEYKTPQEFQQMVLEHIRNNVDITFNENQKIILNEGIVKLGHETKVVFEVLDVPFEINSVMVKNTSFKDMHNNKNALLLLKAGINKEHFILNNENDHTLKLVTDNNKFVLETVNEASFLSFKLLYVVLGFIAVGILLMMKRKKIILKT